MRSPSTPVALLLLLLLAESLWVRSGLTAAWPWNLLILAGAAGVTLGTLQTRLEDRTLEAAGFFLLLLWVALCSLLSQDSSATRPQAGAWACLALAGAGGCQMGGRTAWRVLVHGLLALLCVRVVLSWNATGRLSANFTNADNFGCVLMVGLLLGLGLLARARRVELGLLAAEAVLVLTALARTSSRAAAAGLALGVLAGCAALARRDRHRPRAVALALTSLLAVASAVVWSPDVFVRFGEVKELEGNQGVRFREQVVLTAPALVARHPLLGSGPGTYSLVFPSVRPAGISGFVNSAHNDYVQLAVECGVPGLLLWLGLLGVAARQALRARESLFCESAGALAACTGLALFSLLNFALGVPSLALWWGLSLGLALGCGRPRQAVRWRQIAAGLGVGLLGLLLAGTAWQGARSAALQARALGLARDLRLEEALTLVEQALAVSPEDAPALWWKARLQRQLADLADRPPAEAEATLRAAMERFPLRVDLKLELAAILSEDGRPAQAAWLLRRALAQDPTNAQVRSQLARVEVQQGHWQEAIEQLSGLIQAHPEQVRTVSGVLVAWLKRDLKGALRYLAGQNLRDPQWRSVLGAAQQELAAHRASATSVSLARVQLEQDPEDLCSRWILVRDQPGTPASQLLKFLESKPRSQAEEACWTELATLWLARVPSREGQAWLEERVRRAPEQNWARERLGQLYLQQGQGSRALELWAEAIRSHPARPDLLLRQGAVQEQLHMNRAALDSYREAARLGDPQAPAEAERLERLERNP